LLVFREVAVIPEVGQLYALSIAPIADTRQILAFVYGEFSFLCTCALMLWPGHGIKLTHYTHYKQNVVGDVIIPFAQHYLLLTLM